MCKLIEKFLVNPNIINLRKSWQVEQNGATFVYNLHYNESCKSTYDGRDLLGNFGDHLQHYGILALGLNNLT